MKKREKLKQPSALQLGSNPNLNRNSIMLKNLELGQISVSPNVEFGTEMSVPTNRGQNPNGGKLSGRDDVTRTLNPTTWIGQASWIDELYDYENNCMEYYNYE